MKKNKSKLLIPLIIVIVLIIILGFVLLKDNIFDLFKPQNALTRIDGYPREIDSTKKIEKQRRTIKSEAEFKALMKEIFDDENKIAMPENDFSKSDLFVVTTDLNDTKGFRLKIRSLIKEDETNYKAILERQKPGKTCVNEAITNVAIDIVKIDKNLPEIETDRVDKIITCK